MLEVGQQEVRREYKKWKKDSWEEIRTEMWRWYRDITVGLILNQLICQLKKLSYVWYNYAFAGEKVIPGNVLTRQRGTTFHPGFNASPPPPPQRK